MIYELLDNEGNVINTIKSDDETFVKTLSDNYREVIPELYHLWNIYNANDTLVMKSYDSISNAAMYADQHGGRYELCYDDQKEFDFMEFIKGFSDEIVDVPEDNHLFGVLL